MLDTKLNLPVKLMRRQLSIIWKRKCREKKGEKNTLIICSKSLAETQNLTHLKVVDPIFDPI